MHKHVRTIYCKITTRMCYKVIMAIGNSSICRIREDADIVVSGKPSEADSMQIE